MSVKAPTISTSFPSMKEASDTNKTNPVNQNSSPTDTSPTTPTLALISLSGNMTHSQIERANTQASACLKTNIAVDDDKNFKKEQADDNNLESLRLPSNNNNTITTTIPSSSLSSHPTTIKTTSSVTTSTPPSEATLTSTNTTIGCNIVLSSPYHQHSDSLPPLRETLNSLPLPEQLTSFNHHTNNNNNMMSYQRIQPHSHQGYDRMNPEHHVHGHMYSSSPTQPQHGHIPNPCFDRGQNNIPTQNYRQPAQISCSTNMHPVSSFNDIPINRVVVDSNSIHQQQHVNNNIHHYSHNSSNNYDVHSNNTNNQTYHSPTNHHMHQRTNNYSHVSNSSPTSIPQPPPHSPPSNRLFPSLPSPVPTSNSHTIPSTPSSSSNQQYQQHVNSTLHQSGSSSPKPQSSTFNGASSTSGKSSPISSNNNEQSNAKRTNGHQAHITMTTIKFEELAVYFDWKLEQACEAIGISSTSMKKLCRHFNIPRWPYRKLKSLYMKRDKIVENMKNSSNPQSQKKFSNQLEKVDNEIESIKRPTGSANLSMDRNLLQKSSGSDIDEEDSNSDNTSDTKVNRKRGYDHNVENSKRVKRVDSTLLSSSYSSQNFSEVSPSIYVSPTQINSSSPASFKSNPYQNVNNNVQSFQIPRADSQMQPAHSGSNNIYSTTSFSNMENYTRSSNGDSNFTTQSHNNRQSPTLTTSSASNMRMQPPASPLNMSSTISSNNTSAAAINQGAALPSIHELLKSMK